MPTIIERSGEPVGTIRGWAETPRARARGLLGKSDLVDHGLFVICGAKQVHTFGMTRPIDVALCDRAWNVVHVARGMRPNRVGRLKLRAHFAIEAGSGALGLVRRGDRLDLRDL